MSIEIKKLNYIYGQGSPYEKQALKDVSISIADGEFIGLIGHTGSGKSTLIQHINALLKPTSGEVIVDGLNINADKAKLKEVRRKVGLVFQYPEHQLFEMTVFKDVAFGPTNMKLSMDEINKRVKESIAIVGLDEEIYEKSPFELSGGQKRRVAIAGVLAMKPNVLILDEPTAGLDPRGRDAILNEINRIHKETHITIILVSHSMEDIASYVDRIIVMDNGKCQLDGKTKEVFKQVKALEAMGLSVPQVTYLMAALRKKGIDVSDEIITVNEAYEQLVTVLKS
jgi:energy-coupling factor transport system ATP-binding protein